MTRLLSEQQEEVYDEAVVQEKGETYVGGDVANEPGSTRSTTRNRAVWKRDFDFEVLNLNLSRNRSSLTYILNLQKRLLLFFFFSPCHSMSASVQFVCKLIQLLFVYALCETLECHHSHPTCGPCVSMEACQLSCSGFEACKGPEQALACSDDHNA